MIKKISSFLRLCFVSPECVTVLFCLLLYTYWKSLFVEIGNWFLDKQIGLYLAGGVVSVLAFSIKIGTEILFPGSNSINKKLTKWPNYSALKARIFFSVILSCLCVIVYFVLWILRKNLSTILIGFFLANIFSVCLASLLSLVFASWNIKEIIHNAS